MVVIRGSDTEVNLVLQLAENYMEDHDNASIAVTGGGSGTGIASLINKKADIANSSRAFKPQEIELAKERNVDVTPIVFAIDALTFITHEDLGITSLTMQNIRDIYTGRIENWKDLGGPDRLISLYGRQGNSGTFSFIQEEILKDNYSSNMKQMNGTSQIIEGIKHDKAGIGYVGIGYIINKKGEIVEHIYPLSIQDDNQEKAVSPSNFDNILSGEYAVVRPLYQYTDGKPTGMLRDFILYELSNEGQSIIGQNGYFPITEKYKKMNNEQLQF